MAQQAGKVAIKTVTLNHGYQEGQEPSPPPEGGSREGLEEPLTELLMVRNWIGIVFSVTTTFKVPSAAMNLIKRPDLLLLISNLLDDYARPRFLSGGRGGGGRR